MRAALFFMLFALAGIQQAHAWGQEGHSIIAEIAQQRLDADTLRRVKALLGGELSMASVASWADDYRAGHAETGGWHLVNIPLGKSAYDPDRDCSKDNCVIQAIARFRGVLSDCSKSAADRADALKFVIHFVGDVHQPLHDETHFGVDGKDDRGEIVFPSRFSDSPATCTPCGTRA
ncbi:hypothetical protein CI41S_68040 [Bradyrhizobium ivorense]|nr:S1/P1 nuclease [Bradyrhizobium ivorense]VIO79236.1 hypothetical protein CI41S_68040 [Bradyrhizobium ivorense]